MPVRTLRASVAGLIAVLALGGAPAPASAQPPPSLNQPAVTPPVGYACQTVTADATGLYPGTPTGVIWGTAPGIYAEPDFTGTPTPIGPGAPVSTALTIPDSGPTSVAAEIFGSAGPEVTWPQAVQLSAVPPLPAFTPSALVALTGQSVGFDGSASSETVFDSHCSPSASHALASYTWNFGDGTVQSAGATTSHVYTAPGVYNVTLRVAAADPTAGPAAVTHTIAVLAPPPPPPPPPGAVRLTLVSAHADRRGRVKVRVRCVHAAEACVGSLTLSAVPPPASGRHTRKRTARPIVIAHGQFVVAAGRSAVVVLTLSTRARSWLAAPHFSALRASLAGAQLTALAPLTPATRSLRILAPPARPTHRRAARRAAADTVSSLLTPSPRWRLSP